MQGNTPTPQQGVNTVISYVLFPLDPTQGDWVWSERYQKWHLVSYPCRYGSIIEPHNRRYRWTPPQHTETCYYCWRKWQQLQKNNIAVTRMPPWLGGTA